MRLSAVIAKYIIHNNLYHHHCNLVKEGCHSQGYDRFNVGRNGTKVVKCQMDCFKAGQIDDYHDTGYNLADNGCQSSTGHSHMKSKDKQRV